MVSVGAIPSGHTDDHPRITLKLTMISLRRSHWGHWGEQLSCKCKKKKKKMGFFKKLKKKIKKKKYKKKKKKIIPIVIPGERISCCHERGS